VKVREDVRLQGKVRIAPSGCWEWQGYIRPNGYGSFYFRGRPTTAHRAAYQIFVGPVGERADLDHLCRNRRCVNPDHLEIVSRRENCRRGIMGQVNAERERAKTCCRNGHAYVEDNVHIAPQGWRRCCICRRENQRRARSARAMRGSR
jgi:hypothetical protein